jgi:tRNA(fMet)-specific endonuclease VapC
LNPRYLLDTNTVIYIRQRRPPAALAKFQALPRGEAALSVITYGELIHGIEKSRDRNAGFTALQELIGLMPVLPLPADAGEVYGNIRATLERDGNVIGNNDLWIAAHARAAKLILVSNNLREFRRVARLQLENWVA